MRRAPASVALVVFTRTLLTPAISFAGGGIHYEVREEAVGVLIPSHRDAVSGDCATGTGDGPAAEYVHGGTGSGWGLGAGLGGRAYYQDPSAHANPREPIWWDLRLGAGLDVDLLYAKVPTITQGKLCALVAQAGADVRYEDSSVLLVQVPAVVGAEMGLRTRDDATWHGIVLGWAWTPALTILKPWVTDGYVGASLLGTELSLDLAMARGVAAQEAIKRLAVFLVLPMTEDGPATMTLSFAGVWY
jgi:hypothetical protein